MFLPRTFQLLAVLLTLIVLLSSCSVGMLGSARPAAPPTALPRAAPSPPATPTASLPASALLSVAEQARSLQPAFAADLQAATAWDRYRITAALNPDGPTIHGFLQVEVQNRSRDTWTELVFHLYPNHPSFGGGLRVANAHVNGRPAEVRTEERNVRLIVDLARPMAPGETALVSFDYLARTQRNGSNRAYGAFNQEAGVWALANFHPVLAVYRDAGSGGAYTGWDRRPISSRGDLAVTTTALYDVTIDTPADWALVTTGVRVEQTPIDNGYSRERFVSGPQRDFFLAAIKGLDQASATIDGTKVTSYYQRGSTAAGQRGLDVAVASLRSFNQRFGAYPLTELEVVQAALTKFLGVEYPGVILIEQNLYRPGSRSFEATVAHEVAHQWWYSMVGNDFQGEPWLDEGLASYSQVIFREAQGERALAEAELNTFRDSYRRARAAGRDEPTNQSTAAYSGNYFAIVYAKSALFFHALRQQIGDEAFAQFLQRYYATYRYGEAQGPDLLAVAESTCSCELDQLYADWITDAAPVPIP